MVTATGNGVYRRPGLDTLGQPLSSPGGDRYSVRLRRYCDQAAPLGKVASMDPLGTATITASA